MSKFVVEGEWMDAEEIWLSTQIKCILDGTISESINSAIARCFEAIKDHSGILTPAQEMILSKMEEDTRDWDDSKFAVEAMAACKMKTTPSEFESMKKQLQRHGLLTTEEGE